jgi:predicted kinase
MKQLIVMSAVPGAGKSTWAKRYRNEHPHTIIISSDEIRYELTGSYQDFSKQKEVWELFEKRLIAYGKHQEDITVILDAVIDLNVLREKYAKLGSNYDKKTLVVIYKPFDIVQTTNKERAKDKWVPDDVLNMLYHKFEMPTKEVIDLYDEYIYIDKYF